MKNTYQKSGSETVCCVDASQDASESSATREFGDVLSQILRDGAQEMLQAPSTRRLMTIFTIDPPLLAKMGIGLSFGMDHFLSENS